jgi:hypothetical protein
LRIVLVVVLVLIDANTKDIEDEDEGRGRLRRAVGRLPYATLVWRDFFSRIDKRQMANGWTRG